jgi:hypothetical protein
LPNRRASRIEMQLSLNVIVQSLECHLLIHASNPLTPQRRLSSCLEDGAPAMDGADRGGQVWGGDAQVRDARSVAFTCGPFSVLCLVLC